MLKQLINENMNKELTIDVVSEMAHHKFPCKIDNVLNETDLYATINKKGIIILLLNDTSLSGHYIAITIDDNRKVISYYDPYGFHPSLIAEMAGNQIMDFLVKLQAMLGYKLDINTRRIQVLNNKIQTCGRWASMRCLLYRLNNTEFNDLMDDTITLDTPDKLVTMMTLSSTLT